LYNIKEDKMSYYIGATGETIFEELIDSSTSNIVIANQINLDAGPLSDALQEIITDAAGTALGDLIGETTQVPSALGQSLITLSALGLLAYNKLNRTSVQDVDSMVYSADYSSILTPGMFDDRVRIRYDSNQFSNVSYNVGGVKKGEILTSRLNLLPVDSNNIDLYTSTGKVGIGTATPATPLHIYNATNNILRLQTASVDGTNSIEFVRGNTTDPLNDYRLITDTAGKFKIQYQNNTTNYDNTTNQLMLFDIDKTIIYKPTELKSNILISGDTRTIGYVGIGTTGATTLHTYEPTNNVFRLQTGTSGKVSIEFVRGTDIDTYSDYRFINETGTFKFQYEDESTDYNQTVSNIYTILPTKITIYKNTEFSGNVGIGTTQSETYKLDVLGSSRFIGNIGVGTTPHATYKVDVLGDIRATAFRGDGANITGLNQANLVLTTAKIYEKCEPKTFIINPGDKIDIPPVYSFNITAFDRLANTTATYLEAGKFTCTYEDRNGTYKLIPSYIANTNNKVLLNYRVGDKITFKHTANTQFDYQETPVVKWARLSLFKMPSGTAWNSQGMELYMTSVFDWDSDLTTVVDWTSGYPVSYPRNTPVMMQIETGFKYFFVKWQRNNDPITFDSYITPATESSGMNIAYGGGQGFKISGDYSGSGGYKPQSSSLPPLMTTDTEGTARRGSRLSIDNGVLSADIPTSTDLITNMNTTHFTNNLATSKIDISSSYVAPNATKLATIRNIAGVGFDGSGNIDIPYFNLTNKITVGSGLSISAGSATTSPDITVSLSASQIPDLGAGKITTGTLAVARIPDLDTAKITTGTFVDARIPDLATTKITSGTFAVARIPDLDTAKITTGIFDVLRIPDLATTKITSGTFDVLRIPDLATTKITSGTFAVARIPDLDTAKITTGIFVDARIPDLATTKITSGTFDVLRIPDLATTKITSGTFAVSRIPDLDTAKITTGTFAVARIPDLTTAKITSGTFDVLRIPDLATTKITGLQTALDGKQATLTAGSGISIVSNTISTTSSWLAETPSTNIYYSAGNVGIGTSTVSTPLHIYNASSTIIRLQTGTSGTPSIELVRGTTADASTDWIMTNNPSTGLYNISSSVSGTSTIRFMVSNAGNVGIGGTDPLNKLHIVHNSSTSATSGGISLMVENTIDGANQNSIIHNRVPFVNTANIRKAVYSWGNGTNNGWSAYLLAGNTANGNLRFNRTINNTNATDDTLILNIDGSVSIPQGSLSVSTTTTTATLNSTTLNNTGVGTIATLNSTTLNNTGVFTTATLNNTGVATIGSIITPTTTTGIKLKVLGTDSNGIVATFKESSDVLGVGVKYNGFVGIGANQGLEFGLKGTGAFVVNNDTNTLTYFKVQPPIGVDIAYVQVLGDFYVMGDKEIKAGFKAVTNTGTDYLCVQQNYASVGLLASNWIKVAFGSFTAFHRCYTNDDLYNDESDETIDIFKNEYVGRVVIASGKIKTDFTRKKEGGEAVINTNPELPSKDEDEWHSDIDKDGIKIEDAIPVIQLSRKKKDKRVFGVLGDPSRRTNDIGRLIVNSIGEGAICVSNTNGNIENGDYIQSSDLLGYGEKQDDDLLHNYTIAKATIDCNFELDSPYYQCYEIENGVRVAFIACSYHCG